MAIGDIQRGAEDASNKVFLALNERRKKQQESVQSNVIINAMEDKITREMTKQGLSEDSIAASIKAFDQLRKGGLAPSETMAIGKMMAPDIFQDDLTRAIKQSNLTNAQNKPQEDALKQFAQIVEKNNPMKASSRSGLGMAANATQRADRALALLDNNILTNQDLQGIVGDYAGILQGGAPTVQGMQESEYKSAQQSLKGLTQYISGNPQDAVPQNFKEHIKNNLIELKQTSDGYIQKNFSSIEKAYSPIISKFPDEWNAFKSEWVPQGKQTTSSKPSIPSKSSAPKGAKGWDTEKGDWVF